MKKFLILGVGLVVIVILVSFSLFHKSASVVAFGDSLTEGVGSKMGGGFVSMLSTELAIPIANLGKSGDTTADALLRIGEVLARKPAITILLLGGNDALQKVPEETTVNNLKKIIETLEASGSKVLLLGLEAGGNNAHDRALFKALADQYHTLYIPNILSGITGHPELMSDSLHPNDLGYQMISNRIKPILEGAL